VTQVAPPTQLVGDPLTIGEPGLRFTDGPGIRRLIASTPFPAHAVKQRVVTIVAGNLGLLARSTELFRIDA
jgi:hypothetical protein